jgi:hypothetical protein
LTILSKNGNSIWLDQIGTNKNAKQHILNHPKYLMELKTFKESISNNFKKKKKGSNIGMANVPHPQFSLQDLMQVE